MTGAHTPVEADWLEALAQGAEASAWPLLAWCELTGTCLWLNAAARLAWPEAAQATPWTAAAWLARLQARFGEALLAPWQAAPEADLQRRWLHDARPGQGGWHELLALRWQHSARAPCWLVRLRSADEITAGARPDDGAAHGLLEGPAAAVAVVEPGDHAAAWRWLYRDGMFDLLSLAECTPPRPANGASRWPIFDALLLAQAARQGGPACWTLESIAADGQGVRPAWQLQVLPRPVAPGHGARQELRLLAHGSTQAVPTPMERLVAMALSHTVNGVVITDAGTPQHNIVHVNEGFSRVTGYAAHEVLGRNCNFLQADDRDQAGVALLRQAIARQEPVTVRLRNYRKDGSLFWNQVELSPVRDPHSGAVTHFFALQTDVTLQHQAEEANVRRAIALERVFRGSPMGLLTLDENGQAQIVSPALVKLLGLPARRVKGATVPQLLQAAAQSLGVPGTALAWPAAGERSLWTWTLAGAPRVIEVSLVDLGEIGKEQVAFFRDVTAEQSLHSMKTHFLATAAHELRAPMGSIRGFTELLLMREHSREETRTMLETVLRQSMRLNAMLSDLLDLSRLDAQGDQAFTVGPVALGEAMKRALRIVELPGAAGRVEMAWPPADLRVQGHGAKLEQVLINLLSNALKYSPGGGAVQVRALPADEPGWWALSVQDHGLGLSDEHLQRLFTRFFRAAPDGPIPGTGLGLVIVKELVERMGGRISVSSRLGTGSTFTVHLRLSVLPARPAGLPGLVDVACG
jgi:PAS domain S-box-containing protein